VVLSSFNQPGVQLGAELAMRPTGFAETIITGPPSVLDALADPPLPAACEQRCRRSPRTPTNAR